MMYRARLIEGHITFKTFNFYPFSEEASKIAESKTLTEAEECPESHPFAYWNGGGFCCATNKDLKGHPITLDSRHCENHDNLRCPHFPATTCKNYEGTHQFYLYVDTLKKQALKT